MPNSAVVVSAAAAWGSSCQRQQDLHEAFATLTAV
jgi:hypothetical protein